MTSARTTSLRWAAGVTVSLLALTACGGDDTGATPTPSDTTTTSVTPKPSATTSTEPSTTAPSTTSSPSTSSAPSETATTKPIRILATIEAGQVTTAADTVPVAPGDNVTLIVRTDTADEIHVHGVDQTLALTPGTRNILKFAIPADLAPGQYEVETHENPLLLFTLLVS